LTATDHRWRNSLVEQWRRDDLQSKQPGRRLCRKRPRSTT